MDDRRQGGENNSPNGQGGQQGGQQGGHNNSPDKSDPGREKEDPDTAPGKSVPPKK